MSRPVVLVNGLPAAGKSTLAPRLAQALGLPLFSKDVIKETHAEVLGVNPPAGGSQRAWSRALGRAASETIWALLADAHSGAVLESSWRADTRPLVAAGLAKAQVARVAEVWCEAPLPLLRARYERRSVSSHAIHGALLDHREWDRMAAHAEPLALGPVYRLDTTAPVDVAAVAQWCRGVERAEDG
jgi:glucokinase